MNEARILKLLASDSNIKLFPVEKKKIAIKIVS